MLARAIILEGLQNEKALQTEGCQQMRCVYFCGAEGEISPNHIKPFNLLTRHPSWVRFFCIDLHSIRTHFFGRFRKKKFRFFYAEKIRLLTSNRSNILSKCSLNFPYPTLSGCHISVQPSNAIMKRLITRKTIFV